MKINIKENIRSLVDVDDSELRSSLQTFGWHKEFPALQDETGNILVGHRRIKLATELGIEPVMKTIQLAGNDADGFKLALISNIGHAPLRPKDRKTIAMHLYGTGEWVMAEIAKALGVNQATITRDLEGLCTTHKPHRPKGGRPKAAPKQAKAPQKHKRAPEIVALHDEGKSMKEIANETGVGKRQVRHIVEREKVEREVLPVINREDLSLTAQQKFDAAIKREKQRLAIEFNAAVEARVEDRIGFLLKQVKADQQQAYKDMQYARKGGFKFKGPIYKKILGALHPDSRHSISDARLAEAFQAFGDAERYLLAPEDAPSLHAKPPPLPTTMEEALVARDRARKERSAKAREQNLRRQKVS